MLDGDLGAGKTTLVRYVLQALGVAGRIKSPTYAVVESYAGTDNNGQSLPISHFDFYRFADPREFEDAGFRELFVQPGLKFSEWPDRVAGVMPPPDLRLALAVQDDDSRVVSLQAYTPRGRELLP